jgi:hypothetical protein
VLKGQEDGNGEKLQGYVCKINESYHLLGCFLHCLPVNSAGKVLHRMLKNKLMCTMLNTYSGAAGKI